VLLQDGRLLGFVHRLDAALETEREDVRAASIRSVECLLIALRFLRVAPVQWWAEARRIEPPESGLRLTLRATASVGARAVQFPRRGWNGADAPRLAGWLQLASEAQEAQTPASALRLYFLILEQAGENGDLSAEGTALFECLRALRDFVSHPTVDRARTVGRLRECAEDLEVDGRFSYDPLSPVQSRILEGWRLRARAIVDSLLRKQLGL
jgi:hypothetical protein